MIKHALQLPMLFSHKYLKFRNAIGVYFQYASCVYVDQHHSVLTWPFWTGNFETEFSRHQVRWVRLHAAWSCWYLICTICLNFIKVQSNVLQLIMDFWSSQPWRCAYGYLWASQTCCWWLNFKLLIHFHYIFLRIIICYVLELRQINVCNLFLNLVNLFIYIYFIFIK